MRMLSITVLTMSLSSAVRRVVGLELEAQIVVWAWCVRIENEHICADGRCDRELAEYVEAG